MQIRLTSLPGRSVGRWGRVLPGGGAVLAVASCVPMAAVLPGTVATVLGAVGVSSTTGPWGAFSRAVGPLARPLLIVSLLMLLAGALRCGRGPAGVVAVGGVLLYASMYLLGGTMTGTMTSMSSTGGGGTTNAPLFCIGLGLLAASFACSRIRRWRRSCQPVFRLRRSAA